MNTNKRVSRASIDENYRRVIINGSQTNAQYPSNAISTTKYNVLTFVPLFIYEQFHNYTNCFFLLISIIQQFPEASSLGRFTTLIPLCLILSISAIKEILEDLHRYKDDKKLNKKTVEVFKKFRWTKIEWRDVQVGDIVKVNEDETFPSDLLLLRSSVEGNICYIETVNLDGENNLKIRRQVTTTKAYSVTEIRGIVECDAPNEQIDKFTGILKLDGGVTVPLSADQLLLRGATLRNTAWIVGVVIYSGIDTKIMKNSSSTRLKRSSVSVMVNSQIIILFAIFVSFTILHWIFFMDWNNDNYKYFWYLPIDRQDLHDSSTIVICLIFGVIYSIVIPISLQVMQELSRYIQGMFISNDLDMYYESTDTPAIAKTSSLNEDLGLVKYIFADKTGTLTRNQLEFKCCSIKGVVYDLPTLRKSRSVSENEVLWDFFAAVCLCPGVVTVQNGSTVSYYTASPDHKALILAAKEFGCILKRRDHGSAKILNRQRKSLVYEVLSEFEFSSDCKRTSVVVRNPQGKLILYVMGADDVILARCGHDTHEVTETRRHIDEFATRGLRSMCVAMRIIQQTDFNEWLPSYKRAYEMLATKEKLMEEAEARMVRNLTLLGATAVEDKLQDEVPETIESLQEAGINIWVLTGDKQETAVNIGFSCRLLSNEMPTITLNTTNVEKLRQIVHQYKSELGDSFGKPGNNYGLIVTGDSLNVLLKSENDVMVFVKLMLSCQSVICCRTTPKQKALVVKNVKKYTNFVTLAIGDGANDVAMIQTACIGIGISGMEGLQAANAADYSIGQFKYLKKLLLVHGTWSYNRICKMIYFIYYKNVMIATLQFYYTATTAWSGQLFLDRWAKMFYNVLLTSAPTLALGIFEQNLPASALMRHPHVYRKNHWFNLRSFCLCLTNAFAHSILLSWLSLNVFDSNVYWSSGLNDQYMFVGNIIYTCLILIVCLKCGLHTYHWTNLTALFLITSEAGWLLVFAFLSHSWPYIFAGEDMPSMLEIVFTTPMFWLYSSFIVLAILFVDLVAVVLYRVFYEPSLTSLRKTAARRRSQLGILT